MAATNPFRLKPRQELVHGEGVAVMDQPHSEDARGDEDEVDPESEVPAEEQPGTEALDRDQVSGQGARKDQGRSCPQSQDILSEEQIKMCRGGKESLLGHRQSEGKREGESDAQDGEGDQDRSAAQGRIGSKPDWETRVVPVFLTSFPRTTPDKPSRAKGAFILAPGQNLGVGRSGQLTMLSVGALRASTHVPGEKPAAPLRRRHGGSWIMW